ncbi:class I SAM-dependent methyltransferase [Arthrobacter jiangjiafuii]|uniref:Class I SAM-dependent methyltransferase n=1 Tax=Arthrobacter jiangjiafuii TaxID=2817475 RepID=A0A975M2E3_9MICC|nr:class I SAM-dependent methyltransferase [Arthrobacter jiangjiafuii]MBP3043071.1 class I SAM-dependent methyltransferase [Arthrobacter jiangjiafuii]QWC08640.1 class I SAM-dependent methyltransferase [Arthrobacter jiangjiafuii]
MHDHPHDDVPTHSFDRQYWEQHWEQAPSEVTPAATPAAEAAVAGSVPNPYLVRAAAALAPGTALDAGCGTGAEAVWLAGRGWHVTGADISDTALAQAAERAVGQAVPGGRISWIQADLVSWEPGRRFDLVITNYAHPAMPQLAFYERILDWVAPGGTLLIVGHGTGHEAHGGGHEAALTGSDEGSGHPPAEATVTLGDIQRILDPEDWAIQVAQEQDRTLTGPDGRAHVLADVVVQATRRP